MVKYADGPTTEAEVHVDVTPEELWPFLCDINLPGSFSTEFVRAEWTTQGPALGATFTGYNKHEVVGEWSASCTVTSFEPEKCFEWTVGDVEFKAALWRFDVEPSGKGSKLTFTAEMGPAPSGLTPAIERMPDKEEAIVARRLSEWNENMQRTIEGIKALAEAENS